MNQETFDRIRFKRDDILVKVGWATIRAPNNGTILLKFHEPGEMVNPGTKLLALADLSKVWAYVYVPQPLLSKISLEMPVDGFIPESKMKKIPGKIVHIKDEAEFTPRNIQTRKERTRLVYGVKVEFENTDGFLKPGMTIEVKLPA
jgi:HlyD family secretion protein